MALATPHGCAPRPKASRPARSILPFFPSRTSCSALAEPGKSQTERRALFGVIPAEYDVRAVLALRVGGPLCSALPVRFVVACADARIVEQRCSRSDPA